MKPCPFCGGTSLYLDQVNIDEEPIYFWICRKCGTEGPHHPEMKIASELWNGRIPLPGFQFNFPRTKFVTLNGLVGQIAHMGSEQKEIEEIMLTPDLDHTVEELMDKLHSAESALRIAQEKHGADLDQVADQVERKNFDRGYYA